MPTTVNLNGSSNTLVHKMSSGISTATLPDVCKTPSPAGPVPIPYPNIAQAITLASGTTSVKGDKAMAAVKGSKFALSNGDNAGVAGGVKSSTFMKEATWILYSFDVKLEKNNAARLSDKMFHNAENAANMGGEVQGVATSDFAAKFDDPAIANKLCDAACKAMDEKKKLDAKAVAKGQTPTSKYQNLMRKFLDPLKKGSRQQTPGLMTEVGQMIGRNGGEFVGRWGASVASGPFVKWDIVIAAGRIAKKALTWDKVKQVVEVKFPDDSPTKNQKINDRQMGSNKSKVVDMKPGEDCVCTP